MGNTTAKMSLNHCFQSYESGFCGLFAKASEEFLGAGLDVSLISASYEPAFYWRDNDYFVTQINHSPESLITLKISNIAANLIFLESLGKRKKETGNLKLKDLTELEARILTAYNEFIYKSMSELFLNRKEINSILHTLKHEKTLYFTFYLGKGDEYEAGKIILSFPQYIFRKTSPVSRPEHPLGYNLFNNSEVEINIQIGKTRATLEDVQCLEPDDVIILEQSDLYRMHLKEYEDINININPSHSLVLDFEDENGDDDIVNEVKNHHLNIWDSLEVDVSASFEKVKMKLGDLREITEGLVVDVASISDNKVFIDVEGRRLATGELVIIGDKYGVKITEISKEVKTREVEKLETQAMEEIEPELEPEYEESEEEEIEEDIEDIDESDFEMEEENEEEEY